MTGTKSRILVVDDHPIVVDGYCCLIGRQPDLEVCGIASSAKDTLELASRERPQVVIVDLVLKDSNGLDLIKDLHIRFPEMKLLVVSARDESVFAERALHAGAVGYVSKAEATQKLIDAIREVLHDKIYLSPNMTDRILHRACTSTNDVSHSLVDDLTDRELEAFELIGRGLTTREIATQMHISLKTVDRYRENIKSKLHLQHAMELIHRATIWSEQNV